MKKESAVRLMDAALPWLRRLQPETAHALALRALRLTRPWLPRIDAPLGLRCFGLQFANPLGLAAGFDKNGDYLDVLGELGFGHVELGTVTPRPQPGNPKPRMFRVAERCALINRMGFNNKGIDHLVRRVARSRYHGIRGISIGKNADTPLEDAHRDYLLCFRKAYACADYIAVNVSSPNTARLRELQSRQGLQRILGTLLDERAKLQVQHGKQVPLLVKVAPDLDAEQLGTLARDLRALAVDGVIATNTSTDLGLLGGIRLQTLERGGLSGAPLHPLSLRIITQLRAELGRDFPIIGVGGIVDAAAARLTLRAGADLIQVYTGFAYRGARLIEDILQGVGA